ncbi:hypothetical protein [Dokdonia sp.]|uniref:hypothetical protein n=1 Tax=Dokdonia sp. TaxID=2024995 RepID=UPI003266847F
MKIQFSKAQKKLAILWFISSGIILAIMIFFSSQHDKFSPKDNEAWGWIFSSILPTLSLIITIFVMDVNNRTPSRRGVDRFYFRLVFSISLFYFLVILWVLLADNPEPGIVVRMERSNMYLGPLQGLVAATIGIFFIKRDTNG